MTRSVQQVGEIELPAAFVGAVHQLVEQTGISASDRVRSLRSLFQMFTSERARLSGQSYLDDPKFRAAYLDYHVPINAARAMYVLQQVLQRHPELVGLRRIIDLGGGPGTAAWASLAGVLWKELPQVQVVDRSRGALQLGEQLGRSLVASSTAGELRFVKQSLPALPPNWEGPALLWLAMVLNELLRNRRFDLPRFAATLTRRVPVGSVLIVTEPALRQPGRELLQFHDLLVQLGGWRVLAPCTHQAECPLLKARDRSWCHFHFNWRVPESVQRIARPLGLDCRQPSVAYLALLRTERPEVTAPTAPSREARVIGDPMTVAGERKGVYLCIEGRRELLTSLSEGVQRGDILTFPASPTAAAQPTGLSRTVRPKRSTRRAGEGQQRAQRDRRRGGS